jgi:hypothetical protein
MIQSYNVPIFLKEKIQQVFQPKQVHFRERLENQGFDDNSYYCVINEFSSSPVSISGDISSCVDIIEFFKIIKQNKLNNLYFNSEINSKNIIFNVNTVGFTYILSNEEIDSLDEYKPTIDKVNVTTESI